MISYFLIAVVVAITWYFAQIKYNEGGWDAQGPWSMFAGLPLIIAIYAEDDLWSHATYYFQETKAEMIAPTTAHAREAFTFPYGLVLELPDGTEIRTQMEDDGEFMRLVNEGAIISKDAKSTVFTVVVNQTDTLEMEMRRNR